MYSYFCLLIPTYFDSFRTDTYYCYRLDLLIDIASFSSELEIKTHGGKTLKSKPSEQQRAVEPTCD